MTKELWPQIWASAVRTSNESEAFQICQGKHLRSSGSNKIALVVTESFTIKTNQIHKLYNMPYLWQLRRVSKRKQ